MAKTSPTHIDDELNAFEQAVVPAEWSERIQARRSTLDLVQHLLDTGDSYVELDDHGKVVRRGPAN